MNILSSRTLHRIRLRHKEFIWGEKDMAQDNLDTQGVFLQTIIISTPQEPRVNS
jgi:hypothetical protein